MSETALPLCTALPHCPGPRPCSPHSLRSAGTAPDARSSLPTPPLHHLQRSPFHPSSCLIPGSLSHHPGNRPQTAEWGSVPHWRSSGTTWQRRWPTIPLWKRSAQTAVKGWARAAGSREGAGARSERAQGCAARSTQGQGRRGAVCRRDPRVRGAPGSKTIWTRSSSAQSPLASARKGAVAALSGMSLTLTVMHAPSGV